MKEFIGSNNYMDEKPIYFKSVADSIWRGKFKTLKDYYKAGGAIDPLTGKSQYDLTYYDFDKYELEIDPDEPFSSVENYDPNRRKKELIKCSQSFPYFCHKYVRILHPMRGLIPYVTVSGRWRYGCWNHNSSITRPHKQDLNARFRELMRRLT